MDPKTTFAKRSEVTLLDVRESWEWDAGRIENSVHIPLMQVPSRLQDIPKDRPIVAVCRTGARSEDAAEFLRRLGYDAHNLDGGVVDWTASGLPFEGRVV
jgi:rhodanese-related sulfurtransferase